MAEIELPRDPYEGVSAALGEALDQALIIPDEETSWRISEEVGKVVGDLDEIQEDEDKVTHWCRGVLARDPKRDLRHKVESELALSLVHASPVERFVILDSVGTIIREASALRVDAEALLGHLILAHRVSLADVETTDDARNEQHAALHRERHGHACVDSDPDWGTLPR